jgi:hypothetical protein
MGDLLSPFTLVVQQRPARYFSMYCWLLGEASRGLGEKATSEDFWGRFYILEGVFLCALQLHNPHEYASFGGRIGSEHAGDLLENCDNRGIVDFSLLKKRGIRNGWEVNYKGSMQEFGLTEVDFGVCGSLKLTDDGKALASAYERSIGNTVYLRQYRNTLKVPKAVIQALGHDSCPCRLHDATTSSLRDERREIKKRLIRPYLKSTEQPANSLQESLLLILNVISKLSPAGINTARWSEILTTGLLPDGSLYQPPAPYLETFRKWRLYAFDLLFTYSLESALQGFLEELHSREQIPQANLNTTFKGRLLTEPDSQFRSFIQDLSSCSEKKRRSRERTTISERGRRRSGWRR